MQTVNYEFYKASYDKYGISAQGVHWYSKQTQNLRFEILSSFLKDIKNSSLVDIGCGFGDYILYLEQKNIKPEIYIGIDCEEFMIEICKQRFINESFLKLDIILDEVLEADYLVCSGALNVLSKKDFLSAIKKCFEASKKGFAFNFLNEKSIHELSIEEVHSYCKSFCKKIRIAEKYLHNDSTFFLEK